MMHEGNYLKKIWPFLPIVLFPFVLFASIIFQGKALFWGTPALQFIPWHVLSLQEIKEGILPLWNNLNGMGAPLAANYQTAFFYPPNWPVLLIGWFGGAGWLAWAHTVMICLHLIWLGLGMYQLIGLLGYGKLNRVISALSISMCGYFVARTSFFSMIWAGAWFPWILSAASQTVFPGSRVVNQPKYKINLTLGVVAALQLLAGHAQLTWYTWIFLAAWLGAGVWGTGNLKNIWKVVRSILPALILAAGIAAIQLGITTEYLLLSQRSSAVNYDLAMTYSFWPWRLLGFLLPDLFGNPGLGNYWGYASYWEDAVYIGVLPVILSLLTLPRLWRSKNTGQSQQKEKHLTRFLWVMIIISVILAMGKNTPLFPFLFRNIPTFDMFNSPARYLIWAEISLAILAGIGLNSVRTPTGKGLYWLRLGTAGGFAITLGAFLAWYFLNDIKLTFIRATAICGLFALLSGILILTYSGSQRQTRTSVVWTISLISVIGIDLIVANWHLIPGIDRSFYEPETYITEVSNLGTSRIYIHPVDEYFIKFKRFLTFADYDIREDWKNFEAALIPNLNILMEVNSANNFDPIVTNMYQRWMNHLAGLPADRRISYLQLMDVMAVEKRDRESENAIKMVPVEDSQRFWFHDCALFTDDEESAWTQTTAMVEESDGYSSAEPLILVGKAPAGYQCSSNSEVNVEIIEDSFSQIELQISSKGSGWLMISDSWYPGWKASVDQKRTALFRANYAFKAVYVPPGKHTIEMRYMPMSFILGFCVTLSSILFIFGIIFYRRKH